MICFEFILTAAATLYNYCLLVWHYYLKLLNIVDMQQSDGSCSSLYTYGVGTIQFFARSSPCLNKQGRHEENNKHRPDLWSIFTEMTKQDFTTIYNYYIENVSLENSFKKGYKSVRSLQIHLPCLETNF